jgi:hypothetical protein
LSLYLPTADSSCSVPRWGTRLSVLDLESLDRKEMRMRLVKRIAIALGSLLAIMLAGGAHYRV